MTYSVASTWSFLILDRTIQMKIPMRKKALGERSMMPLGSYHPPSETGVSMFMPKSFPLPKSSRKNPTAMRMML